MSSNRLRQFDLLRSAIEDMAGVDNRFDNLFEKMTDVARSFESVKKELAAAMDEFDSLVNEVSDHYQETRKMSSVLEKLADDLHEDLVDGLGHVDRHQALADALTGEHC